MPRILVLEDDPLIAAMMGDWLCELGCEIIGPTRSVNGALGLLQGNPIDAAILDVSLPAENCYPVAAALRGRGVPLAFATGHTVGAIAQEYRDALMLPKPFDFAELRNVVARLLSDVRPRTAANPH
jgi:DNA-binding response OmpR family regulator